MTNATTIKPSAEATAASADVWATKPYIAPPKQVWGRGVMIPGIAFSRLTLLTTMLFPLMEERMQEVRGQLEIRRRQNKDLGVRS